MPSSARSLSRRRSGSPPTRGRLVVTDGGGRSAGWGPVPLPDDRVASYSPDEGLGGDSTAGGRCRGRACGITGGPPPVGGAAFRPVAPPSKIRDRPGSTPGSVEGRHRSPETVRCRPGRAVDRRSLPVRRAAEVVMAQTSTTAPAAAASTTRQGMALIRELVGLHPLPFAVAVTGAAVYAAATVGSTIVLGRITDRVVFPTFETGEVPPGSVAWAIAAIAAMTVLRVSGVVTRRYYAGMTSERGQRTFRPSPRRPLSGPPDVVAPADPGRPTPGPRRQRHRDHDRDAPPPALLPRGRLPGHLLLRIPPGHRRLVGPGRLRDLPRPHPSQPDLQPQGRTAGGPGPGRGRVGVGHRPRELRRGAGGQDTRSGRGRGTSLRPSGPATSGPPGGRRLHPSPVRVGDGGPAHLRNRPGGGLRHLPHRGRGHHPR